MREAERLYAANKGEGKSFTQEPKAFEAVPGRGLRAAVGESEILVGNDAWMEENEIALNKDLAELKEALEGDGKTVVMAAIDKTLVCIIAIADVIKPEAALAIEALQKLGITAYMLTGDNKRTAAAVGECIQIWACAPGGA